jgi:cytochrome c5
VRFILAASLSVFVVVVSQAGCASSKPDSRAAPERVLPDATGSASEGNLSDTDRYAAAKLYHAKCARCHKFYDPAAYNQAEWDVWMQKMGKKSKLKPVQFALLSRYLETFRAAAKAPER